MRFLTYNAGGLGRGPVAQSKGDWLLSYLCNNGDVGALAIQETHCGESGQFCQAVRDMGDRFTVVHSPAADGDGYAGVMLVISREFKVEEERVMIGGRVMAVRVANVVYGYVMDLVVVYGYPTGRQEWLGEMATAVDVTVPTVVMGDFNFVTDVRDRDSDMMHEYDVRQAGRMGDLTGGLDLFDAYRLLHEADREYSFIGVGRSRIDRFYVDGLLAGRVKGCRCLPVLGRETGHKMVELEIGEEIEIGRGYWKFNVSLLKDRAYVGYIRGIIRQARETRGDGDWDDPGEWWDFLKFLLRAETVGYCREKEKKRREYVAALMREKEELENDVWYGIGGEEAGADLRRIYHLLEEEEGRRAEGHRVRARVPNFGAKEPGLAYISKIEKWTGGRNLIYALKDREGRVRYGTEGVLDIAHEFYTDLYTSQGTDEQAQDEILDALDSTLTPESRDMCDARVTAEELAESLRGLQNGKSPGSDGFPAEFWKCFWGELSADFKSVVDWVYDNGRLTGSMAGGIIRLLFKKGDRLDVRNYRPITLVNADYKIISKTIARRMAKVLPELIHPDQTCVPGRHISTNIHVLRDVVEYCDGTDTEGALLFGSGEVFRPSGAWVYL